MIHSQSIVTWKGPNRNPYHQSQDSISASCSSTSKIKREKVCSAWKKKWPSNFQRNCSVPGAGKSGRPLQVATPNCHRRKRRRRQGRQSHRRAGQLTEEEFLLHQKLKRGVVVKFKEVCLGGVGLIPITLPPIFFLDKEVFLSGVKKWERKRMNHAAWATTRLESESMATESKTEKKLSYGAFFLPDVQPRSGSAATPHRSSRQRSSGPSRCVLGIGVSK